MDRFFNFIFKHKILVLIIIIIIFVAPIISVHIIFKLPAICDWLIPKWSAGDVLGYIAGFESFIGTVILSVVAIYQNINAQNDNKRISEENNYLQKISIQKLLPVLKVTSIRVKDSQLSNYNTTTLINTVTVTKEISKDGQKEFINTYINTSNNGTFEKEITLSLENISDGVIRQISFEKIKFSSFRLKQEVIPEVICIGLDKYKCINRLMLPHDSIEVTFRVYFDDSRYKQLWDYKDNTYIGCFGMYIYLTNTSIAGIDYAEEIYIEKTLDFEERIIYKAYDEDKK